MLSHKWHFNWNSQIVVVKYFPAFSGSQRNRRANACPLFIPSSCLRWSEHLCEWLLDIFHTKYRMASRIWSHLGLAWAVYCSLGLLDFSTILPEKYLDYFSHWNSFGPRILADSICDYKIKTLYWNEKKISLAGVYIRCSRRWTITWTDRHNVDKTEKNRQRNSTLQHNMQRHRRHCKAIKTLQGQTMVG